MKRLLALLFLVPAISLAEYHPDIPYGIATTVEFNLYNTDGTLDIDEVDGGTEVTIHCDGDAGTTATNDFVDEGSYYSLAITAAEAECERISLDIAATDRNVVLIRTIPFHGTAQSATASTIVLDAGDAYADDLLIGGRVCIVDGTGEGQCRIISDNVLSTDTLTVEPDWTTNPTSSSGYRIEAGSVNVSVWDGADITTALQTATDIVNEWETQSQADPTGFHVNVLEVNGTAQTANDNAADINAVLVDTAEIGAAGAGLTEAGGTGDHLTAQPTQNANVIQVSGDATAADNLEAAFDGTGYIFSSSYFNVLASGTCDSGTTTTCVDATLTEANDYWKGAAIIFTSGTIANQTSCVFDFVAASDTLTFRARTAAVSTNTYVLIASPLCEGVVSP